MIDRFFDLEMAKTLPSSYEETLSYEETILKLITYVNKLYSQYERTNYSNEELNKRYKELINDLNKLKEKFEEYKRGKTIPDGSITLKKLNKDVMSVFNKWIIDEVHKSAKFIFFEMSDDGRIQAVIPDSWKEISFYTDNEFKLNLVVD